MFVFLGQSGGAGSDPHEAEPGWSPASVVVGRTCSRCWHVLKVMQHLNRLFFVPKQQDRGDRDLGSALCAEAIAQLLDVMSHKALLHVYSSCIFLENPTRTGGLPSQL